MDLPSAHHLANNWPSIEFKIAIISLEILKVLIHYLLFLESLRNPMPFWLILGVKTPFLPQACRIFLFLLLWNFKMMWLDKNLTIWWISSTWKFISLISGKFSLIISLMISSPQFPLFSLECISIGQLLFFSFFIFSSLLFYLFFPPGFLDISQHYLQPLCWGSHFCSHTFKLPRMFCCCYSLNIPFL